MGKSEKIYGKYIIHRTDGTPIDPNDEYFVLKVKGSGDLKHVEACRQALLTYAICIRSHLPELATDIENRYGDSHSPTEPELVPQIDDYDLFDNLPEFDTLQEGDWCKFENESQARENSKHWIVVPEFLGMAVNDAMRIGVHFKDGVIYIAHDKDCKTQLTAPEFIRRAENTFKTK